MSGRDGKGDRHFRGGDRWNRRLIGIVDCGGDIQFPPAKIPRQPDFSKWTPARVAQDIEKDFDVNFSAMQSFGRWGKTLSSFRIVSIRVRIYTAAHENHDHVV